MTLAATLAVTLAATLAGLHCPCTSLLCLKYLCPIFKPDIRGADWVADWVVTVVTPSPQEIVSKSDLTVFIKC